MLRSLTGEGTALARQVLSALDQMTPPQRRAAGEVIGQALVESDDFPDLKTEAIGELWFRDLELTAWRVLHADRRSGDPARPQSLPRRLDERLNVSVSKPYDSRTGNARPRPRRPGIHFNNRSGPRGHCCAALIGYTTDPVDARHESRSP
ncbi:hypothetical protein OG407_28790 [Streptomyces sp. NBC_01515]|uniref:hypothetical protein n=1 Tax=Streptomyces sp. NBC_01515 TaxID=2903890 RepID=UPI00386818F4